MIDRATMPPNVTNKHRPTVPGLQHTTITGLVVTIHHSNNRRTHHHFTGGNPEHEAATWLQRQVKGRINHNRIRKRLERIANQRKQRPELALLT